jgi:hypothetical protein
VIRAEYLERGLAARTHHLFEVYRTGLDSFRFLCHCNKHMEHERLAGISSIRSNSSCSSSSSSSSSSSKIGVETVSTVVDVR